VAVIELLSGDSGLELMVRAIQHALSDDEPGVASSGHYMTVRDQAIVFTVIVILR